LQTFPAEFFNAPDELVAPATDENETPTLLNRAVGSGSGRYFWYRIRFLAIVIVVILLAGLITGKIG
jgi:hypothetical protein